MNTRQLQHFLAVLESRSILKAAAHLNLSQPAISKSLARLEDEYGAPLFERLPRGVQPTAFALTLERHARRILADIERSRHAARGLALGSGGSVLLGTGPMFVPVASAAVRDMLDENPDVEFSIIQGHNDSLRSALLVNRIDLFVAMITGFIDGEEFVTRQILSDRIVCVCRMAHPLLEGTPKTADLQKYGWVLPEVGEIGRTMLEAYLLNAKLPPPMVKVTTNSDRVVRHFLQQSDLLGILPELITEQQEYRDIATVQLEGFSLSRKVGIVRRRGQYFSPAADLLEGFLEKRLLAMR